LASIMMKICYGIFFFIGVVNIFTSELFKPKKKKPEADP